MFRPHKTLWKVLCEIKNRMTDLHVQLKTLSFQTIGKKGKSKIFKSYVDLTLREILALLGRFFDLIQYQRYIQVMTDSIQIMTGEFFSSLL